MSLENKLYKGDEGIIINVDTKVDISDATVFKIGCKKPNSTVIDWNAVLVGPIGVTVIATPGIGYLVNDILTVELKDGTSASFKVTAIDGGGGVTAFDIENRGTGYYLADGLTVTGGTGLGFTFNITSLIGATTLKYTIGNGDFDQKGVYQIQSIVETPNWNGRGETLSFEVFDLFA